MAATQESIGVAVIYLSHKEIDVQTPLNLLAGLWRQLVSRQQITPDLIGLYKQHCEQHTRPSLQEAHSTLRAAISEYSNTFIIVDAIDEYPEEYRHSLLLHLTSIHPSVRLMLTSRPHINIHHTIPTSETLTISATEEDIRRYLDAKILSSSRLSSHVKNCPDLREEIERVVVRRSDGMCVQSQFCTSDKLTSYHALGFYWPNFKSTHSQRNTR
jgi:hypothetical protein